MITVPIATATTKQLLIHALDRLTTLEDNMAQITAALDRLRGSVTTEIQQVSDQLNLIIADLTSENEGLRAQLTEAAASLDQAVAGVNALADELDANDPQPETPETPETPAEPDAPVDVDPTPEQPVETPEQPVEEPVTDPETPATDEPTETPVEGEPETGEPRMDQPATDEPEQPAEEAPALAINPATGLPY